MQSGRRSRMYGLLWLLYLLQLPLPSLLAQDVSSMTDTEIINELLANLNEREQILTKKESLLQQRDANSTMLAEYLQTIETSLTARENLLDERLNSLTEIENSLTSLNADLKTLRWVSSLTIATLAILAVWGWMN